MYYNIFTNRDFSFNTVAVSWMREWKLSPAYCVSGARGSEEEGEAVT